ncbi:hypothetical protein [Bacillus cereus group sp. MYBK242-2]|uniref:hypothetical protein n=1 Tax=Bacillus cereus group sp. MYBK242-2 TaxID=3450647 RepID=UPI003F78C00D
MNKLEIRNILTNNENAGIVYDFIRDEVILLIRGDEKENLKVIDTFDSFTYADKKDYWDQFIRNCGIEFENNLGTYEEEKDKSLALYNYYFKDSNQGHEETKIQEIKKEDRKRLNKYQEKLDVPLVFILISLIFSTPFLLQLNTSNIKPLTGFVEFLVFIISISIMLYMLVRMIKVARSEKAGIKEISTMSISVIIIVWFMFVCRAIVQ